MIPETTYDPNLVAIYDRVDRFYAGQAQTYKFIFESNPKAIDHLSKYTSYYKRVFKLNLRAAPATRYEEMFDLVKKIETTCFCVLITLYFSNNNRIIDISMARIRTNLESALGSLKQEMRSDYLLKVISFQSKNWQPPRSLVAYSFLNSDWIDLSTILPPDCP